jgi:hypothetical protein
VDENFQLEVLDAFIRMKELRNRAVCAVRNRNSFALAGKPTLFSAV